MGRLQIEYLLQLLIAVSITIPQDVKGQSCAATWTSFGGSCYKFPSGTKTWAAAKGECAATTPTSHITVVNSQEELDFLLVQKDSKHWIGCTDADGSVGADGTPGMEGTWVCEDLSGSYYVLNPPDSAGFWKWKTDEPNSDGDQDCIELLYPSGANEGQWNDKQCSENRENVCEYELPVTADQTAFAETEGTDSIAWPVTWVPGCTPKLKFSVKMSGDDDDGVAKILLASDTTPNVPYLIVQLGWNAARNAPGDGSTPGDVYSYILLCTNTDSTCLVKKSQVIDNGDVSADGYVDFELTATSDSVSVAYCDQNPFMSINNLDTSIFDPADIRYIGIQSHDGGDSNDQTSSWKFPTDDWDSLATGKTVMGTCTGTGCADAIIDGDVTQCFTTSPAGTTPYLQIDLGEEMHVVGVTIYNSDTNSDHIEDVVISVGSCNVAQTQAGMNNVQCSSAISAAEAGFGNAQPVYRACPTNTYGRYVYLDDTTSGSVEMTLCEVIVHGKSIDNADKTNIEFEDAAYSAMESPGANGVTTSSQAVTLIRSGSASRFTCDSIDIVDTGTGSALSSTDYTFVGGSVDFNPGAITKLVGVVDILGDCDREDDETIILKLDNPSSGVIGSQSSTTITVADDDPLYKFSVSETSVREDDAAGKTTLTVERSEFTSQATTVYVSTLDCGAADTRATDVSDYISLSNKGVTFGVGDTTQTVDVYIVDDNDDEADDAKDEQFCVELSKGTSNQGEVVTPNMVEVTIINDDTVYQPCGSDPFMAFENEGEIEVSICRIGFVETTGCVDIYSESSGVSPSATEGEEFDYPSFLRRTLSFAPSQTSRTVRVPINDDGLIEDTESFQLTLALPSSTCDLSPHIGTASAILQIQDEDATYSVTSLFNSIPESAGSVTVSFSRLSSSRAGTIRVRVSGSSNPETNIGTSFATEGVDFTKEGEHDVTFDPDITTAELRIPVIEDPNIELDENFYVEIIEADSEISPGRKRTEITILNNDAYISLKNTEQTVMESVEQFHVVVQRGPLEIDGIFIAPYLDDDVTITLNTKSDLTSGAIEGSDFELLTPSVTFLGTAKESVKTATVRIINDQEVEREEIFYVSISSDVEQIDPERDEARITIQDDDGRISCHVDGNTVVTVDEGQGSVTITCTRTGLSSDDGDDQSLNRAAEFVLTAVAESALQGEDFNAYQGRLEFPYGVDTIEETINNLLIDDDKPENSETFRLEITDADSETETANSFVTITILDNDKEQFGFENIDYSVGESCEKLQVMIVRTGPSGEGTTLRITASDGTGSSGAVYPEDYTTLETFVTFLRNQRQQVVTIDINKDEDNEGSETFSLTLSVVSGSGEVNPTADIAVITIRDQTVTYSVQDPIITRDESSGTAPIVFVRNGDFCDSDEIFVGTRDGTARSVEDYISFNNRRVTFGKTSRTASVDLTIVNNNIEEPIESFTVVIQSGNVQEGAGQTVVSIQDDDGRVYFRESEKVVTEGDGSVILEIVRGGSVIASSQVRVQTIRDRGNAAPGSDYISISNMFIEFGASETSKTFVVDIIDNEEEEDEETFTVEIVGTTNGIVSDPSEAVITILDDDGPGPDGLPMETVIAIAAGAGGIVLVLMLISGGVCLALTRSSPRATTAAIARRAPLSPAYNVPMNYPQGYGGNGFGSQQYGTPQGIAYY